MEAPVMWSNPTDFPSIRRARQVSTVQVNLGYVCNQTCFHCHVNAGPNRRESMDAATLEAVLAFADRVGATTLDLTGGAPELNPHFRWLVTQARERGWTVIDRCNLTVLTEPGQDSLAEFLADHQVQIVASLPCYEEANVDQQRGEGVFQRSLQGIRMLNALGYGQRDSGLPLDLVYNPQGAELPPPQGELEAAYRESLLRDWSIHFNHLLTITNMPINRFAGQLRREGRYQEYMDRLRAAHRTENLAKVMCRDLVSVDWKGYLFDCDFNQMLGLPLGAKGQRVHVQNITAQALDQGSIAVGEHCYGCTAGAGSSCSGAL
ncbi:arsenosugar biosynthesis radical SAM (seleno)protein ArsS [Thioalkalivibrio sp. ALJ1]|uniref:arsenosugar biosynthesis radical SAM (seleno)protein ArsS n=1 Tax=Thioalkalivibrio sp. ALJ1 TaxID=1158144 RepID=UPI00056E5BEE|nr:arsenosugar biosynthesis radical SAM (seleno)protein ArsS [Thioalkalivibrio sp. ALJ1]